MTANHLPDPNARAPRRAGIRSLVGLFSGLVPGGDAKRRWLVCLVGLAVLAVGVTLLLSREGRKAVTPRVVVLAAWYSNGEQMVRFRPEPASAEITYADLVSFSDDGHAQPRTVANFGQVFPIRDERETNYSLHFVGIPRRGARMGGRALAYTPGSYTVAYTPTGNGQRIRVGVALERKGIGDCVQRIRKCCQELKLAMLWAKSYRDPSFVTTEPITNAVTRTQ